MLPPRDAGGALRGRTILAWVYGWSLATAETEARRLRRKNAMVLRLAIEQSEYERKELTKETVRLAKMKIEQDGTVHRMNGPIVLSDSDFDDDDIGNSSCDDQDPPSAADGYSCTGDPKGKRAATKW
ncbi:Phosphorylated carbohydrates phosphatase [Hordeum vulgare]|nr:Phosphorylated carbohydrates phosphatase [Hordeum vulgare]